MPISEIRGYFSAAIDQGASDLHLVAGQPAMLRIQGQLSPLSQDLLDPATLEKALLGIMSPDQQKVFTETQELDMGLDIEGTRFRINVHRQEGAIGMAARLIPRDIPTPDALRFEAPLLDAINLLDGLVLVVGPTGHGKSTTLAAMIEEINKTRKSHVITIEDPIEFQFEEKESVIEQREVGTDTQSFDAALKHVLRQDPNVILVGEMRDPETISTVLTAAETGHLVFSTLHTSSAAEAIERIVDVFDGAKQKQVLIQLAAVLRIVVAQQLLPCVDGGRVAAREILVNTPAVANLIRENNIAQIGSVIQTGAKDGMLSMKNALEALLSKGLITDEVAERRGQRQRKI